MTSTARIGREPVQKPGRSKQDYGTPWELIRAIEARFGKLTIDLAATAENKRCDRFISPEVDSLAPHVRWASYIGDGIGWLNPPFEDIAPWAEKCLSSCANVILLTPASIGSEWFAENVESHAAVVGLRPRLIFEGCKDPYPKDCMLTLWGSVAPHLPSLSTWRWR